MRRSLPGLFALAVLAVLGWFAWRWFATPVTPSPAAGAPKHPQATSEAVAPPPAASAVSAERGEEAIPPPPLERNAATAAARRGANRLVRLPVELSVVDRATREPLRDVELRYATFRGGDDAAPIDDAPDRQSFVRGDSPLTIPAVASETAIQPILVRAPGHATARLSVDFRTGGQREVALEAACELDVMVDAPPGQEKFGIELRRIDDVVKSMDRRAGLSEELARCVGRKPPSLPRAQRLACESIGRLRGDLAKNAVTIGRVVAMERPAWSRAVTREEWSRFDRLAPGDWVATLVTDKRGSGPLDIVVLHLDAGAVERRTLAPRELPKSPVRAVRGTIVLLQGWERDEETRAPKRLLLDRAFYRTWLPAETQHCVVEQFEPAGSSRFSWSAGELGAGLWIARLPQFGVAQEFEVGDDGSNDVAIEVAPPCDVDLALVDAQTQQAARFGQVTVSTGDGDSGGEARRIGADASDGHFRFRAPVGRLHVRVDAFEANQFLLERAFDLVPGRCDLVFALEQVGRARLLLSDGGAGVPWSSEFRVAVTPLDGAGGFAGWHDDGNGVELLVAPAGRYSLTIDDLQGFEPAGPVEFEVGGGATVEVPIKLTRSK